MIDAVEAALEALWKAAGALVEGQGPIARRNARARVAKAMRRLRHWVDECAPPPSRKSPKLKMNKYAVRARKEKHIRELEKNGWVTYPTDVGPGKTALRRAVALRVKIHVRKIYTNHPGVTRDMILDEMVTAPGWLVGAKDDAHARRLSKSRKLREAWSAEQTLQAVAAQGQMYMAHQVAAAINERVLQRTFKDALFPKMLEYGKPSP